MSLLGRFLVLAFVTVLSVIVPFAQEVGIDLRISIIATDVLLIDDFTYQSAVHAIVLQQEGYVREGVVAFHTEWETTEFQTFLNNGETPVEQTFFVPEEYLGSQVEIYVEVWPLAALEYDESNNSASTRVQIPSVQSPRIQILLVVTRKVRDQELTSHNCRKFPFGFFTSLDCWSLPLW